MAKRKAKRRKPRKSPVRKSRKPFVGDQILSMYAMLQCGCMSTIFAFIASTIAGLAFTEDFKTRIHAEPKLKDMVSQVDTLSPSVGIAILVFVGIFALLSIKFVLDTWKGRKWAIWIHFLLHAPSAAAPIIYGNSQAQMGSVIGIVIAIYCLLRIFGSVGPRL